MAIYFLIDVLIWHQLLQVLTFFATAGATAYVAVRSLRRGLPLRAAAYVVGAAVSGYLTWDGLSYLLMWPAFWLAQYFPFITGG